MSETDLEQWYELLAIAPGASLGELEVAYRQQRYRLSREGSELQREQLKTAYCHLKAHLETPTSEPTGPEQSSVTGPQERVELPPGLGVGESPQEWVDLPPDASPGQQEILSARNREVGADPATVSDPLVALLQAKLKAQDLKLQVKRKGTQVLVLLAAAQVPEPEPLIRGLERELRELELPGVEVAKIYALRHWGRASSPVVWRRELQLQVLPEPERSEDLRAIASQRFSFQNLPVNALAFPLATLLALGLNASLIQILLLPWQIWIHEFGHATVAWLGGRRATPLPFGWTNYTFERSLFVYFGILILLGLLFRAGWQENLRWPRVLAVGIAILQFIFTWLLPQRAIELLITFGGIGGEFYLSTFLMVCFYCRFPDRWRWDFWRYLVLVIAASTFWKSFWLWHRIQRGQEAIPWGTLLFGQGDAGGDMNRLNWDFGWRAEQIIQTYTQLGHLCLLVLLGVYLTLLLKQSPRLWSWVKPRLRF